MSPIKVSRINTLLHEKLILETALLRAKNELEEERQSNNRRCIYLTSLPIHFNGKPGGVVRVDAELKLTYQPHQKKQSTKRSK